MLTGGSDVEWQSNVEASGKMFLYQVLGRMYEKGNKITCGLKKRYK